jgi:RNA polymerase sigma-70 factor (ECF subfamily)
VLEFRREFGLNRDVPTKVTSLIEIRKDGGTRWGAFATTHWSVVLTAQGDSPAAEEALERLCRTYWWPLYGFVRRAGQTPEEAQDLTQGFFAMLLERKDLEKVRQEKGRLRSYLLASLKNFLAKDHRRATTIKRGAGRPLVPLDDLLARERADLELANALTADKLYERRWALTLLEQVFKRLEDEHRAAGNLALFEQLKQMLVDESDQSSHLDAAQKLGLTKAAVRQAAYRLRQRCRILLREEIAHTVATPEEVEDELRHFIAALRT